MAGESAEIVAASGFPALLPWVGPRARTFVVGTAAKFYNPKDIAIVAGGTMYVADKGNYTIRKDSQAYTSADRVCQ